MTQTSRPNFAGKTPAAAAALEAERDYYDCLARFGHASAEAHVAEVFWRRLRSRAAQSSGP